MTNKSIDAYDGRIGASLNVRKIHVLQLLYSAYIMNTQNSFEFKEMSPFRGQFES